MKMNIGLLTLLSVVVCFSILFNIFVVLFDKKLKRLENQIMLLFEKRTNLIPSLYEITKNYITKHEEVFSQILNLRKIEFSNYKDSFIERVKNEAQIHRELNFIFKIISKHPKIQKNGKYLLIRDLFLDNSLEIGKKVELYKKMVKKINFFLLLKNMTVIGLFIKIKKRDEI